MSKKNTTFFMLDFKKAGLCKKNPCNALIKRGLQEIGEVAPRGIEPLSKV